MTERADGRPVPDASGEPQRRIAATENPHKDYLAAVTLAMDEQHPNDTWLVLHDGKVVATNEDPQKIAEELGVNRGDVSNLNVGTLREYLSKL